MWFAVINHTYVCHMCKWILDLNFKEMDSLVYLQISMIKHVVQKREKYNKLAII